MCWQAAVHGEPGPKAMPTRKQRRAANAAPAIVSGPRKNIRHVGAPSVGSASGVQNPAHCKTDRGKCEKKVERHTPGSRARRRSGVDPRWVVGEGASQSRALPACTRAHARHSITLLPGTRASFRHARSSTGSSSTGSAQPSHAQVHHDLRACDDAGDG